MKLGAVILREIPQNLKMLTAMNIVSGIVTALLLAIVGQADGETAKSDSGIRLAVIYLLIVALFSATNRYILVTASQDGERLIHKLRLRLFDAVRRADLVTVETIGRAALHGVLVRDTQTLAQILPLLAIGGQQAVLLVFLAAYLAWLSPMACAMAFGFAGLAVVVRVGRRKLFERLLRASATAETDVFRGLTDILRGFKEMRMSRPRAEALVNAVAQASGEARRANIETKTQWSRNFALIESMFYTLIGLMVFVVPLLSQGYHEVVMPATMAALFIVGPVGTVSFVLPMAEQAELSLSNIEEMERRLAAKAQSEPEPEPQTTPLPRPSSIALSNASFAYRDPDGRTVFKVGPLSAEFHAGEITFVTGGNGSGKSTMLRLLTALMPVDNGALLVDGQAVAPERMQDYRNLISAIFTDYHLSRRLYGIATPAPERAHELLKQLEMHHKVSVRDNAFSRVNLSTGQRKRLALIAARLADKPVIVLDEWAADQDPHFRAIFYEELLPQLKAEGKIVICVTHDDRWFSHADRIYHMDEGHIEAARRQS